MKNNKSKKKEKTKAPDYLADAVSAVRDYDDVRLGRREIKNETLDSLHKKAVKNITICNNMYWQGYTSISKARDIITSLWRIDHPKTEDALDQVTDKVTA